VVEWENPNAKDVLSPFVKWRYIIELLVSILF
jgi:hypothetical protein